MRLVCGAASGMFMLAGLHNGSFTPHDNNGKMANYAFVQQLAGTFKDTYGSLICAELLGLAPKGSTMNFCLRRLSALSPPNVLLSIMRNVPAPKWWRRLSEYTYEAYDLQEFIGNGRPHADAGDTGRRSPSVA